MSKKLTPPVNEKDHYQGPAHAPLVLVEYGDYQCPHCGAAYPIIRHIQKELGDKLKFVFRNFPLNESHPQAFAAAVAAEAAGLQDAFWEMHDSIYEHQDRLESIPYLEFAKSIGIDTAKFRHDLQDVTLADKVEADFAGGMRSGVNGTPTFFINEIRYDGRWDEMYLLTYLRDKL